MLKQSLPGFQNWEGIGSRQERESIRICILGRYSYGENPKGPSGGATQADFCVPRFPAPCTLAKVLDQGFMVFSSLEKPVCV